MDGVKRPDDLLVIAPNFKRRLSGVTSTIVQLVPLQARTIAIATLGPGLPDTLPKLHGRDLPKLWRKPKTRPFRIWHARRNVESLAGVFMRDVLRMPLKLVFTSASQRQHTRWTRFLISRMDAVVATSERTASYLRVPSTVIMHGIDLERFHPAPDKAEAKRGVGLDPQLKTIGCFGRIRRQKGTDLFVDAMIDLLPAHPGWNAVVAGRATAEHQDFLADLKDRVAKTGLAGRILFVGEHNPIAPWYQALDLFIAPQRWEGFGLTPLEAMASGLPVVATDVGAFSELIVDDVTGCVVKAGDAAAIIAATQPYLADPDRLAHGGRAALAHVQENFALQREADQLANVYGKLWRDA